MFDIENFNKVINLTKSYTVISKGSEPVDGFCGIQWAKSWLSINKIDNNKYTIQLYITNEYNKIYNDLGEYEYVVEDGKIYEINDDAKYFWNNMTPTVPAYYTLKNLFKDVIKYLTTKTTTE